MFVMVLSLESLKERRNFHKKLFKRFPLLESVKIKEENFIKNAKGSLFRVCEKVNKKNHEKCTENALRGKNSSSNPCGVILKGEFLGALINISLFF